MKTALKVLSVIVKAITIIFAVIGVMLSIVTVITTKTFIDHVDDIIDEDEGKDAIEIASEAYGKVVIDERVRGNAIVKIASKVLDPFVWLFVKF